MTFAAHTPRPRALLIARNLPPLRGGIERLMPHAVEQLSSEWACDVIGPTGCAAHLTAAAGSITEVPAGVVPFLARTAAHLAVSRAGAYELCIASSGLMAPLARLAAWRSGCPYLTFVYGLDLVYDNPVYRAIFLPAIRAADRVVACSDYTADLAAAAGVVRKRLSVIRPGVDIAAEVPETAAQQFAEQLGLAGHPLMVFVGRLVERKGVAEFVEHALPRIVQACPAARLLVVGAEPGYSGRATGPYRERIRAAAVGAGVEAAVVLAGELDDAALQLAYAAADVLVFPTFALPGDVEGFGMVAIEAAAQGTPTVAFAVGGVPDAVSADSGVLLEPGNYAGMADAITGFLRGTVVTCSEQSCRAHARGFQWDVYGARVREACRLPAGGAA